LFKARVVKPEENKHQRLHTTTEESPSPNEAEEKDLLESERLKAITNLQKYHDEKRSWRARRSRKKILTWET
jgi:hypothetical protein